MHHWFARQRWLIVALCVTLLMSGAPAVMGQVAARENLLRLALTVQAAEAGSTNHSLVGVPPDPDERFLSNPVASGANPPYPLNHTFDADPLPAGTPPTNAAFEAAGSTVGTPPANFDFASSPTSTSAPSNADFATGDFSDWTTSGTTSIASDTPHGAYAQLGTSGVVTTSAFTVASDAQVFVVDLGFLTTSGFTNAVVYALTDPSYSTQTQLLSTSCNGCNQWQTKGIDATAYRGQSIKLKISRTGGTLGVDNVRAERSFPDYTTSGAVVRLTEAGGNAYARLEATGTITSSPFSVTSTTQFGTLRAQGLSTTVEQYYLYVLSGVDFATQTQVVVETNLDDGGWTTRSVNLVAWQGQTIKLKVVRQNGAVGIDDLGVQAVVLPDWEVQAGKDATLVAGGPTGNYAQTNGALTSSAFTLGTDVQQLTVRYQSASGSGAFYCELLTGPTYSTVIDLAGGPVTGDPATWQTLRVGVTPYLGQSVKLRLRPYLATLRFDDAGLGEISVPGWTLSGIQGVLAGEDTSGTYVTAARSGTPLELRSADIATGIIDTPSRVEQRFYAITYSIGGTTGSPLRVTWHNPATGQSWVVFQDASNTPTGVLTKSFALADFMGTDGYFSITVPSIDTLYSVADNIARQQLGEPFSEKVGQQIDTSTGSFGFQERDLSTAGTMPLSFTRYYAGHADTLGTLGYRWSHTYDTRLAITNTGDVGVIFGAGKEAFFDEQAGLYTAVDVRIHDTLVKNADGTFDFTTTANLTYHFSAAGRLESITDLNDNLTTLSYDGNGRLVTVSAPGSQTLTLAYDGNGRLASVTDPVGAVVTYGYDANGDLTSVTDPETKVRTYTYSRHRLTSVTDPNGRTLFTNTLDSVNRVITQTDAANETITIAYSTPSKGVTSVTDSLNRTATFYFDRYGRTTDKLDPDGRVISHVFDADGNLDKVIDRSGEEWDFAYNGSGDLTGSDDPLGNPTTITWNAQHLPATMTDARGNVTSYTYDADGNVLTLTNALNQTTTYTYDSAGNMLTETNPLNQATTYTYSSQGHRLTKTDPLNHTWTWTYDAAGRVLTETNPLSQTTTYTYNLRGNVKTMTDPLGNVTEFSWDPYGNLWVQENALGYSTVWNYDSRALITSKTDTASKSTTYTYDDAGNMLSMTDPLNHTTSWTYDSLNRIISETTPTNGTTTFTYDAEGRLASEVDPLNRTISYGHDAAGRLTSKTLPNGGVWTYTYDANGSLLTETDPMSRTTTYSYDALNRVSTKQDALANTTTYTYDAAGRLASVADPLNHTTSYTYNAAGQLITMTDALNGTVTFSYDAAGRQTGVTNPRGQTWTTTYDANGKVLSDTDPLNRVHTYTYDAMGQLTSETDARNITVGYSYDPRGLRTAITYPGGSVSFAYDDAGRRTSMTDATGTTTWGYDAANRIASVAAPAGTMNYTFNSAGQRATMVLPGNRTVSYGYNAAGLLTSLTDWQSRVISFSYNLAEQRTAITRPNGVTTSYGYDAAGRLTALTHTNGGVTLQSFSYTLDGAGNRTGVTTAAGVESYTYDALNRLTQVLYPNGDTVGYSYDAQGNRLTQTLNGVQTASYTYDNADQLTSDGTRSYTYDAAGNMLTAGTDSYTWDWANRLTSATVNGTATTFAYDGDNVRTSLTTGGTTTSYVWDRIGSSVPLMVDDGTKSYLHAGGVLAEIDAANAATYPLADALGSVRGVTDNAGVLVGTRDYDVFGATRASTGVGNTFGYTGEQSDASTGLTYLRARYLNPSLGRFLSFDTVQPNAPGTQGYNRCAYVANNPVAWTDPSGHSAACENFWGPVLEAGKIVAMYKAVRGYVFGKGADGYSGFLVQVAAAYSLSGHVADGLIHLDEWLDLLPEDTHFEIRRSQALLGYLSIAVGILWWGDEKTAIIPALGLLIGGVLLMLGALVIEALIAWREFEHGLMPGICNRLPTAPPDALPTFRNNSYVGGSDSNTLGSGTLNLPILPSPSRPISPSSTPRSPSQ